MSGNGSAVENSFESVLSQAKCCEGWSLTENSCDMLDIIDRQVLHMLLSSPVNEGGTLRVRSALSYYKESRLSDGRDTYCE